MAFQPRFRGALRHALEDQPVEDGYQWLKYGQKMLSKKVAMGNNVRRHYFQCKDRACPARRFIDQDLSNPSRLKTTYHGQHTCSCSGGTSDKASADELMLVESDSAYSEDSDESQHGR